MKINKLAIAAFGLGIVISLVSCDSASPKVLPDSEKTVNGITSAGPEGEMCIRDSDKTDRIKNDNFKR